jgi:hypothetical protein
VKALRPVSPARFKALVFMVLLVVPYAGHAERSADIQTYLRSIQRLFDDLEYERALDQIRLARQAPRAAEEEVTLSLYEGIIQYELGKQEQSKAAFKSALLLRPDAALPVQVAPKVRSLFESVRQQVKLTVVPSPVQREAGSPQAKAESQPTPPSKPVLGPAEVLADTTPRPREWRRYALIPAIAGGALAVSGGIAWGVSRGHLNQLRSDDPKLATLEDVQREMSQGRKWQTAGISLLSVGAAGLAAAAGMYVLGGPEQSVSLSVGSSGNAAFVYGRWP